MDEQRVWVRAHAEWSPGVAAAAVGPRNYGPGPQAPRIPQVDVAVIPAEARQRYRAGGRVPARSAGARGRGPGAVARRRLCRSGRVVGK